MSNDHADPVVEISRRFVGVYGTAPTCYLSLLARIPDFTRADLDGALYERRSLVRVRAMRYSVHMLPPDLLPMVLGATRDSFIKDTRRGLKCGGLDATSYPAWGDRIEDALAAGPLRAAAIREVLELEGKAGSALVRHALSLMCADARAELARRYVEAFGPATYADFLVDPADAERVYDRRGNATSVVLVDGRVAGVWDLGREDDPLRVRVAPFEGFDPRRWPEVEAQVTRIAALVGASCVEVSRCPPPGSLKAAPLNRFLAPLR